MNERRTSTDTGPAFKGLTELPKRPKQQLVFTTGMVGTLCSVAPRTVAKWCSANLLPYRRIPGSLDRRIDRENFITFLKRQKMHSVLSREEFWERDLAEAARERTARRASKGKAQSKRAGRNAPAATRSTEAQPTETNRKQFVSVLVIVISELQPEPQLVRRVSRLLKQRQFNPTFSPTSSTFAMGILTAGSTAEALAIIIKAGDILPPDCMSSLTTPSKKARLLALTMRSAVDRLLLLAKPLNRGQSTGTDTNKEESLGSRIRLLRHYAEILEIGSA